MMNSPWLATLLLMAAPVAPEMSVPAGYTVERVAESPLVEHPAMATFGPEGRLFVAETGGSNEKVPKLNEILPGSIRVLHDTDGDGKFDKHTVFADRLAEPTGVLWHRGALYVAAAPNLWKLVDTDGDGVADEKTNLIQGMYRSSGGFHGPFLGPTGRLFWTTPQTSHEIRRADGSLVSKGRKAMVLTARTDGSDLHWYAGGGMANHVEVAFSPEGDMFGTVPLLYRGPRRDALIHWVYGGSYFSRRYVEHEFPFTGELLGHVIDLGHVAPAGLTRSRSGLFDEGTYFLCEFNKHRVMKVALRADGSTYVGTAEPFLTSTGNDVHFTDVFEDADGSLLAIDTGGWYVKGCPASQIAKPDIKGAIYRIRRQAPVSTVSTTASDPRGLKADYQQIALLDDPRFMVRDRALDAFAEREDVAELRAALQDADSSVRLRRNAVWALSRIDNEESRAAIVAALGDNSSSVRQAAAHACGKLQEPSAVSGLVKLLSGEPRQRRAAATALGRIGDESAVAPLLAQLAKPVDRMLEHALIYALLEIDAATPTAAGLVHDDVKVQRAALIALDQMAHGQLTAAQVTPLLVHEDEPLREVAYRVARERREWAPAVARSLRGYLTTPERVRMARETILTASNDETVLQLISESLKKAGTPTREELLSIVAETGITEPPRAWVDQIEVALNSETPDGAIAAVEALRLKQFLPQLLNIGLDEDRSLPRRLSASLAKLRIDPQLDADTFAFAMEEAETGVPTTESLMAVQVLGSAQLTREQLLDLAELLMELGPVELPTLLTAFDKSDDPEVGRALVEALGESDGLRAINARALALIVADYPADVQKTAESLIQRVADETRLDEDRRAKLLSIVNDKGDPENGRKIFFGKGTCHLCHRVGDQGGQVGPDLSLIGQIRNRYDFIESIGVPSASFARGYEPVMVTLKDGTSHIGRFGQETEEHFEIINAQGKKLKFKRDEIFQVNESRISVMPEGLDLLMTRDELNDLVAYLKSLK